MSFFGNSDEAKQALAALSAIKGFEMVVEFGMDGTIVDLNPCFLDKFGYQLDDLKGKQCDILKLVGDTDSTEHRQLWTSLRAGVAQSMDQACVDKSGAVVWLKASYIPVLDSANKPVRVVALAVCITDQKIKSLEDASKLTAVGRVQAMIEFNLDGTIINANEKFLSVVGYSLAEIKGKHHSMFVEPSLKNSSDYQDFWSDLRAGDYKSGEFKRVTKSGADIWIIGSYNPIFDDKGRPFKIVKIATDITTQKIIESETRAQITAIGKSQAVIEFAMDGTILDANENFLRAVGYSLVEIKGRHHSMFVDSITRNSNEYGEFWAALGRGQYQAAEYKRIGKGGNEIWIQASYNPIIDLVGKPFKVIKYATDVTSQVLVRMGNERVCGMMETVAAGAEELNASVREISEAMVKSRKAAVDAVQKVENADSQAQNLNVAAQSMRGIVELISSITGQINLLALNATIESARAGEAGRGFAVVASEVKSLANQAKQATDRIGQEIGNLNNISGDVVVALESIKGSIQNVSEYVTATAAAVEEQSTVTSEMSSSMQRAASEAAAIAAR